MPSHLSSIGFPLETREDFGTLARRAAEEGQKVPVERGFYIVWSPGAGIQLWLQTDPNRIPIGCNPHFADTGRVAVAVTQALPNDAHPLDGSFHCWADPGDDLKDGAYPFLFDCPDFDVAAQNREYPCRVEAQVAAFAEELICYPSEASYSEAQRAEGKGPGLAPEGFIPTGLFAKESTRPRAVALFAGRILQSERRVNPISGNSFYWLSVQTYGGIYDVVADPILVPEPPVVGGIVRGSFWLSGRFLRVQAYEPLLRGEVAGRSDTGY